MKEQPLAETENDFKFTKSIKKIYIKNHMISVFKKPLCLQIDLVN